KIAKYHAAMPVEDRVENQTAWENRDVLITVATSAFALGLNCANVRFVIHTKMPTSMGTFLQESGRAGRDGAFAKSLVILSVGSQKRKADAILSQVCSTIRFK
ncbi:P-loop containing nucleoside triphosphate hydrolase protein, partial [Phlyctochytrium arcticum]